MEAEDAGEGRGMQRRWLRRCEGRAMEAEDEGERRGRGWCGGDDWGTERMGGRDEAVAQDIATRARFFFVREVLWDDCSSAGVIPNLY